MENLTKHVARAMICSRSIELWHDFNWFYLACLMSTGIIGGKFLERERIQKPDQPRFGTELSEYFTAKDLYVGSRLNFHGHYFILIDADEYAFLYMEKQALGVRVVKLDMLACDLLYVQSIE